MMKLTLNIYGNNDELLRVAESSDIPKIKYGIVRKLMKLLDITDDTTSMDILKSLSGAWDDVTNILGKVFPDVTDDEWDNVDLAELVPVLVQIVRAALAQMNTIPKDPKNLLGA